MIVHISAYRDLNSGQTLTEFASNGSESCHGPHNPHALGAKHTDHRLTAQFGLEGTFRGHLVPPLT